MPYYFGEGDPGWNEDGEDEYRPPKVAQFRYLPPPDVGGPPGPVRFSDQPPAASPLPRAAPPTPSLLDRLLGRRPPPSPPAPRLTWEEQQQEQERRGQHALALFVAALREIGARRVYGRYDGGNDEGFAWLDHVELRSGDRLAADEVTSRLAATSLVERLADADLWHRRRWTTAQDVRELVDFTLAPVLAARLLGGGYGTGPFCLYGAFTVDLDACTIVDDPDAAPVVRNFTIEE